MDSYFVETRSSIEEVAGLTFLCIMRVIGFDAHVINGLRGRD